MAIVPKSIVGLTSKFRQLPRYMRLLTIALSLYFVFTVTLGLILPYVAEKQAPKQLSNMLQRTVTLDDVSINPFTLSVAISQFKIQESKTTLNSDQFVGFEKLTFEYRFWHSIFNAAFSIADVTLLKPSVNLERLNTKDSVTFNFSDIIDTLAQSSTATDEPQQTANGLAHFMVENLAIVDAYFSFIDNITQGQLRYPQVNLNIKSFDSKSALSAASTSKKSNKSNHYSVHLVGNNGGEIATQGEIQLEPFSIVGDIQLTDIQLPQFWSFIDRQFIANLASGKLTLNSQYRLETKTDHFQVSTSDGQIKLEELSLRNSRAVVASLPLLAIEGIAFNLLDQSVSADLLHSQGLVIDAQLDKKGSNLEKLFQPKPDTKISSTSPTQQTVTVDTGDNVDQSKPWRAVLNAVDIKNVQINLNEKILTEGTLWQIDSMALKTDTINADLSAPIDYQLSLNINQQASLSSNGSIDVLQQQLDSQLLLTDFNLSQLQNYLSAYINIELQQGLFSTTGKLQLDNNVEQLTYQGQANISDLLVKDTVQKKTLLKWNNLDVDAISFDKAANSIEIETISFDKPYGRLIIAEDKSTNFAELTVAKSTAEATSKTAPSTQAAVVSKNNTPVIKPAAEAPSPMAISINKISIKDGSTFFADNSLTPNFAASIEQLNGEVTKLSSSSERAASVDIKGKIDRYAPVTLKGDINPLLAQPFLDLALGFKHVELTSVNPYSGTYAGYYIDKGQLSLDLNYRLENNQLVGDNHLVVNQLELGKPSDSSLATTLPVTLAIALLQDRHGVIDLGLQVSGDLDEPSFSFGSIVMTAFTNVITKAVTAPFSLLAGLLGADDDQLDKVNFHAGSSEINENAQQTLNQLAKGLADRPMLMLNVEGAVNVAEDNRALAEAQLQQKLAQLAQMELEQLAELTASSFPTSGALSDALKLLYETELAAPAIDVRTAIAAEHQGDKALTEAELATRWHIALYNFSLSAQRISEDALGQLAQQRAVAVKTFLANSKAVSPERVFLLDSRVNLNTAASQALLTLSAN